MTQEEKYNAAIEQAKKELAACGSMDCDAAKLIFRLFPQLRKEEKPLTSFQQCLNCILRGVYYAEVPDEKVNEFILNVVRTRTDELVKLAKKQEKQKHPDGCFTCDEYKKGYEEGRRNGFTAGYNKAMKEVEQKEQKPVEYLSKRKVYDIMNKLTELSTSELIPLESEEYVKIHEITSDVCSLLDYPVEQKPAEWSEEDEDMLNSCISSIEEAKENRYAYKETDGDTSYDHEIAWLKSLRPQPHWKPSEEQMNALSEAVSTFDGYEESDAIKSLYNDLKKLM